MTTRSRMPFYVAVFILISLGLVLAMLRHTNLGIPLFPGEQKQVWLVEARVDFVATGEPVLASLNLPLNPPGFRHSSELAASPGYGFSIIEGQQGRRAEWSKSYAQGPQTLYFKTQFVPTDYEHDALGEAEPQASLVFWEEPQATAVNELLQEVQRKSSTPESVTRELLKILGTERLINQNAELLLASKPLPRLSVDMLNYMGIPARLAEGLTLEDARRRQTLQPYIQIYNGENWRTYNANTGEQGLPDDVLLWRQGASSLLDVAGGSGSTVSFSILRQTVSALQLAKKDMAPSKSSFFSLHYLPVEEQSMFRMLLLLPLGALLVAFMRIVIGIKTSGTFMPVLIAIAFVQTSLLPGLIAFITVVGLGLMLRGYLARLNLLLVSRISALILLVIFITIALSILGYQAGYSTGMTVTFFPMVILAWTIERMSILWEEEGGHEVAVQGAGSLFVAICTYFVMMMPLAGHLTFNFPELHLVTLGLILLMGNYTGYKLSELRRFRPMKKANQP